MDFSDLTHFTLWCLHHQTAVRTGLVVPSLYLQLCMSYISEYIYYNCLFHLLVGVPTGGSPIAKNITIVIPKPLTYKHYRNLQPSPIRLQKNIAGFPQTLLFNNACLKVVWQVPALTVTRVLVSPLYG